MKKGTGFIKNHIVTGVLVIVPIALVVIILADVLKKLLAATEPLTSKMSVGGILGQTIVAIVLLVLILAIFFFIGGLFFDSYLGKSFNSWLEKKALGRIPFYSSLKGVANHFAGIEQGKHAIVEVDLYGNNCKQLGFLSETLDDGRCLVYVPNAPVLSIGQVHIVPKEHVVILDMSLKAATDIVSRLGFGANELYNEIKETDSA